METFYITQVEPKHDPLRVKYGKGLPGNGRELDARMYCPYAEVLRLYHVPDGAEMERVAKDVGRGTYGASRPGTKLVPMQNYHSRHRFSTKDGKVRTAKQKTGRELLRFKSHSDLQAFLRDMTSEVSSRGGFVKKRSKPSDKKKSSAREVNTLTEDEAIAAENVADPCEKCGAKMISKMGRYGWFLACPEFPTCRNARDIEVSL